MSDINVDIVDLSTVNVAVDPSAQIAVAVAQLAPVNVEIAMPPLGVAPTSSGGIPAGGAAGQALTKATGADFDLAWGYPSPIDGGTFN